MATPTTARPATVPVTDGRALITPSRPSNRNAAQAQYTHSPSPTSPDNLHRSKHATGATQRAPIQTAPKVIPMQSPPTTDDNQSLRALVQPVLAAAQNKLDTLTHAVSGIARALEEYVETIADGPTRAVAKQLSLDFPAFLANSLDQRQATGPLARSYATTLRGPQAAGTSHKLPTRPLYNAASATGRSAKPKTDNRLLIRLTSDGLQNREHPMTVRQQLATATGLTLTDIPKATPTATGWAVHPANEAVKRAILDQQKAITGAYEIAENIQWHNYIVGGVERRVVSLFQNFTGNLQQLVIEEAKAQTGKTPVRAFETRRSAEHPEELGTWLISFDQPVAPFRIFGTSNRSQPVKQRVTITRHDPGCQGFCNNKTCTRPARCKRCAHVLTDDHEPATCTSRAQCANCLGPHQADYEGCLAKPSIVHGQVQRYTHAQLKSIRRKNLRLWRTTGQDEAQPSSPPSPPTLTRQPTPTSSVETVPDQATSTTDSIHVNTEEFTGMDMDEEMEILPHMSRKRIRSTSRPTRARSVLYESLNEADMALHISSPSHA